MRNPCKECDYYHKENNTCQSKKCCTGGDGTVTIIDRLFCKPYKYKADRKTENSSEKPNKSEIPTGSTISKMEQVDEPQTESTGSPIGDYRDGVGAWQTDCGWK